MNNDERGPWYLLTGLVIGILIGIVYAWVISPVQYVDTEPASLREDLKERYRALIAEAYAANRDLPRAQARLALLRDPNIADTLAAQAQRALAQGRPESEVRALGLLAAAVNTTPSLQAVTPSPASSTPPASPTSSPLPLLTPSSTPSPTLTPTATRLPQTATMTATGTITITAQPAARTPTPAASATLRPSPTPTLPPSPTPTLSSPFILDKRSLLCDPNIAGPLLIIRTLDADRNGVPGIEAVINWDGGEEHFFTGLKPELGLGYADFAMTPDIVYTLRLADGSQLITDLTAAQCQADNGQQIWGTWELIFIQP